MTTFIGGIKPDIAEGVNIRGLVDCQAKVTIGKNVFTGHEVMILTGSHDYNRFGKERIKAHKNQAITIEEGVWIGSRAIILGGVLIGENAVIGAGSVVTKNIPAFQVWAGNPCKFIKTI